MAGLDRPIFHQMGPFVGTGLDLSLVLETCITARLIIQPENVSRHFQPGCIALQNLFGSLNRRCVQRFSPGKSQSPDSHPGLLILYPFRVDTGKIPH
jgi:hypothetical protein